MQKFFLLNYDKSKMTLKTILKNFLNYADTLDTQKKLGKDIYEVDFQVFIYNIMIDFVIFLQILYFVELYFRFFKEFPFLLI